MNSNRATISPFISQPNVDTVWTRGSWVATATFTALNNFFPSEQVNVVLPIAFLIKSAFMLVRISATLGCIPSTAVNARAPVPVEPDVGSPEFCQVPFLEK